ncbi:hypothetical protein B5V02_22370 [Mesorhizobium kowhaii]|uniref:Uncharacterized protein n=1 Tax=Mesorhizobium kowhaii TaxID=1300272 RepID=A0A2W7BYV1_9HYPH|nr:hypothetical protein B5V02_22370 [Mesorhizobium kowhaii]
MSLNIRRALCMHSLNAKKLQIQIWFQTGNRTAAAAVQLTLFGESACVYARPAQFSREGRARLELVPRGSMRRLGVWVVLVTATMAILYLMPYVSITM